MWAVLFRHALLHMLMYSERVTPICIEYTPYTNYDKYSSIDPLISISAFDLLMRGSYLINPSDDIMSINDDDDDNADNDNE